MSSDGRYEPVSAGRRPGVPFRVAPTSAGQAGRTAADGSDRRSRRTPIDPSVRADDPRNDGTTSVGCLGIEATRSGPADQMGGSVHDQQKRRAFADLD
jgi:hypothetical protein